MRDELQAEYNAGRFDMAVAMASGPIATAGSAANYLYQAANARKLTQGDLIALRALRAKLRNAAGTLDQAIALGQPKLLQAAE
jgi:hypothetical protein